MKRGKCYCGVLMSDAEQALIQGNANFEILKDERFGERRFTLVSFEEAGLQQLWEQRKAQGCTEGMFCNDGCVYVITETEDFFHRFRLYTPRGKAQNLPLLVFLHGLGEMGTDNSRHLWTVLFLRVRLFLRREKCVLLAPQLSFTRMFNSDEYSAALEAMIDWTEREKQTDPARRYIVGRSYGAHGAFYEAMRRPERYAAAMLLSGWWYTEEVAKLRKTPQGADIYHATLSDDALARLREVPLLFVHSENDKACTIRGIHGDALRVILDSAMKINAFASGAGKNVANCQIL